MIDINILFIFIVILITIVCQLSGHSPNIGQLQPCLSTVLQQVFVYYCP